MNSLFFIIYKEKALSILHSYVFIQISYVDLIIYLQVKFHINLIGTSQCQCLCSVAASDLLVVT